MSEPRSHDTAVDRLSRFLFDGPINAFRKLGEFVIFAAEVLIWLVRPPFRWRVFLESFYFVGVGSIFIIVLVSLFVGGVFALQSVMGLSMFDAESMAGGLVGLSLTRELAPVFTALMLTARAGSAMATELGTMRVSDQIDALTAMGISPIQYLVVPRVAACTGMAPVLCTLFNFMGLAGSYLVCVTLKGLDPGIFQDTVTLWVEPSDILGGLQKSIVLGFFVSLIACREGFYAGGGAAGVGRATTRAVVNGFVVIFVLDYLLTSLIQV